MQEPVEDVHRTASGRQPIGAVAQTAPAPLQCEVEPRRGHGGDEALPLEIVQEGDRYIGLLEDGKRLRVEPTRNVLFTDAFDKKVLINETTRIRTAELVPGERV